MSCELLVLNKMGKLINALIVVNKTVPIKDLLSKNAS